MVGSLGGMDGESKSSKGGYRFANEKPAYICKQYQLNGLVNVLKDVEV